MRILSKLYGRTEIYFICKKIYSLMSLCLNYGRGWNFQDSGEKNVLKMLSKYYCDQSIVVFDVGANVGEYSFQLIKSLKHVDVYAFEPSTDTFSVLRANIMSRGITNIHAQQLALSNSDGESILYVDASNSEISSLYPQDLHKKECLSLEKINTFSLDSFMSLYNLSRIHFLKVDVEGHDINVLHGASTAIKNKKIDFIQFEFGECNISSRTFLKDYFILLNDNFQIYKILQNGLIKIEYDVIFEVYRVSNYLAVRRNMLSGKIMNARVLKRLPIN